MLLLAACDSGADAGTKAAPKSEAGAKADTKSKAEAGAAAKPGDAAAAGGAEAGQVAAGPVLDHAVKMLGGEDKSLADFRGKALLVVNTASQCGYTPQYEGLQELYAKYKDQGFEVLAFPSNDFGAQEPGSHDEIKTFVTDKYGVEFPMFAKVPVIGDGKVPLYKTLTEETAEGIRGEVKWNFTKFLVDPQGRVIARYEPNIDPMDTALTAKLESVLPKAG